LDFSGSGSGFSGSSFGYRVFYPAIAAMKKGHLHKYPTNPIVLPTFGMV